MGIEIRQLIVKSDVVEGDQTKPGHDSSIGAFEFGPIKEQLIEECKQWLLDQRVESRER